MRFDFHQYLRIDIDEWFVGLRHWDTFIELVGELPMYSRYGLAIMDDDELLEAEMEARGDDLRNPSVRPPLSQWSAIRADLTDVKDLLMRLTAVTARAEQLPQPLPRPETARDRYEKKQREKNTKFVESFLFPDKD